VNCAAVGVGLRAPHISDVLARPKSAAFFEVHAENYMGGGPARAALRHLRQDAPISLHCVGLSLGTDGPIDRAHLLRLRSLVHEVQPFVVSEHLAWSCIDGVYLNDLCPVPYTEESLALIAAHVGETQEALGMRILIENPASYLSFAQSSLEEAEFLSQLCSRTGCGVLLDVNNLYVASRNIGLDMHAYLRTLPPSAVRELHLAGHHRTDVEGRPLLIDDHGSAVQPEVWELFAETVEVLGTRPTLIEWDSKMPQYEVLLAEAAKARRELSAAEGRAQCAP